MFLGQFQAFERELCANQARMEQIGRDAEVLLRNGHAEKQAIGAKRDELGRLWQALVDASQQRSRSLEEARDLLDFNQLVDRALAWIREKVTQIPTPRLPTLSCHYHRRTVRFIFDYQCRKYETRSSAVSDGG